MEKYECNECGMGVKGMTCAKCGEDLKNDTIEKNGKNVQVAKCPNGCGKIKSPTCCGQDMDAVSA